MYGSRPWCLGLLTLKWNTLGAICLLQERTSHLCGNQCWKHHHTLREYKLCSCSHEVRLGNIQQLVFQQQMMNSRCAQVEVEEEKPEIIIKEKKEPKRSKSWGRRSTRAKKTISYRFVHWEQHCPSEHLIRKLSRCWFYAQILVVVCCRMRLLIRWGHRQRTR